MEAYEHDSEPPSASEPAAMASVVGAGRSPLQDFPADPLADRWADVVAQLEARSAVTALVRELAVQAQCVAWIEEGGTSRWRLRVERESLRGDSHRDRLCLALSQLLGHEAVLELEGGAAVNTPAQREQLARERRQRAAEDLIQRDPLVVSLLGQHSGARIVAGSIKPL